MLAWVAGGLYALVCTISVSELATTLPQEGGWYVYARRAFGGYGGFLAGYSDLLVQIVALAYVSTAAGEFVVALLPDIPVGGKTITILMLSIFGILHYLGIRIGSGAQKVNTIIVGLGLVGFVIACFILGDREAVASQSPALVTPTGLPLLVAFVIAFQSVIITYDGWYCAIYFMEENQDPTRTLPRSAIGGVVGTIGIFLLINLALLYVLPISQMAGSTFPAGDAARIIFGKTGRQIVLLISFLTVIGIANSIFLIAPRILYVLGRDGYFSRRASNVNRGGTPVAGLFLVVLCTSALVLLRSFEKLLAIQAVLIVVLYLTGFVSLFVLRKREPNLPRPFHAWGYPWTPLAALLGSLAYFILNLASDFKNGLLGLAFLAMSYPVFVLAKRLRRETART
jgi:APA family basic amino acid/polyamine antiporter